MQVIIKSRLKEILDERERTAAWLARKLERTQPQISAYVNGLSVPKYDMQLKIAHVLGVDVSDIWPAEVVNTQ